MVAEESLKTPVGDPKKTSIKRTIQCRLYFDPIAAKSISEWLNNQLVGYEKDFGKIISKKDLDALVTESDQSHSP
jgi:hypothetical protein